MAITKADSIKQVDIKPDGSIVVYSTVVFSESGQPDIISNKMTTFAKSDSKTSAIAAFIENYKA
jgi:hypothetical protein|tara:strand:- start:37931 stop:38122 length:192 start_codon:yes stop_codon:yes gene_type:complete